MPQDQKFCSRLYRGQDWADADFPALVTAGAVAVLIMGLGRTHYRNLSAARG